MYKGIAAILASPAISGDRLYCPKCHFENNENQELTRFKESVKAQSHDEMLSEQVFYIGCTFYTATGEWRCTEIGLRTIIGIKIEPGKDDWYNGPPYAVVEGVFDAYDWGGMFGTKGEAMF